MSYEKFKKGDRVKSSEIAKKNFRLRQPDRHGTVVGVTPSGDVVVIFDGTKTRSYWFSEYLELLLDNAPEEANG